MSGWHGRRGPTGPGGPDDSQAATDAAATETARVIAGLRARLGRLDVLWHPVVRGELDKLEEQITILIDEAGQHPGRHRSPHGKAPSGTTPSGTTASGTTASAQRAASGTAASGTAPSGQIGDAQGYDLKPDPLAATTPAEFITALRQYRAWSGDPSWRKMAARAGQAVVHSTMHTAMRGDTLPKFEVMKAIVIGCGGDDDDLRMFATAWRRIESATAKTAGPSPKFLTAPLPAFPQYSPAGRQYSPAAGQYSPAGRQYSPAGRN